MSLFKDEILHKKIDKIADVSSQQYSHQNPGHSTNTMYTQQFSKQYTRNFSNQFRVHYGNFGGARFGPYYTGHSTNTMYTQQFPGNYLRNFNNQFTGYFAADTIQNSQSITEYYLWRRVG